MPIGRLRELDGIRGIACMLVLLDHVLISELYGRIPGMYRITPWLIGGVDLFFVLSGFLIGGILIDNRSAPKFFQVFWVRRFARIMPVYYLLMLSFFICLVLKPFLNAPWLDLFLFKDIMPLWSYPLFVQNFAQSIDGGTGGARWVASTWSLAIEEQFYLLLPPLTYILSRRSVTVLAASCVAVAWLVRGEVWLTTGNDMTAYFLLPGRMDALAFGLLGALAVRNGGALAVLGRARRWLDGVAVAIVVALSVKALESVAQHVPLRLSYFVLTSDFTFRAALFAYAIVRVFLVPEGSLYRRLLSERLLVFIGTISYALYMYHPAVNGLIHGMIFADEPAIRNLAQLLTAFLVIAISIALAWLSTQYFELPIRRWSHRVTRPRIMTEVAGGVREQGSPQRI